MYSVNYHRPTSVADAVRDFVGPALASDDITMLAIRRIDPSAV